MNAARGGERRPPARPQPAAVALGLALMLALAFAGYQAARRGLADVIAGEPRYQIERWRTGQWVPDSHKLDALQDALERARGIDPDNPSLIEELGHLHATRVQRHPAGDPHVRAMRRQALLHFRQALAMRPTSGHGYTNIALMKYRLGEIDREYSHLLQQAMRRAPWEPKVQMLAIELGIAAWQALAEPARDAVKQAIQVQARWQPARQKPALESLLKRYRRTDLAYLLE